jgi:hypothetical protein
MTVANIEAYHQVLTAMISAVKTYHNSDRHRVRSIQLLDHAQPPVDFSVGMILETVVNHANFPIVTSPEKCRSLTVGLSPSAMVFYG